MDRPIVPLELSELPCPVERIDHPDSFVSQSSGVVRTLLREQPVFWPRKSDPLPQQIMGKAITFGFEGIAREWAGIS